MKVAKILTSILALVLGLIAIRWIIYPELSAKPRHGPAAHHRPFYR